MFTVQLISLQQYFPILMPCNITRYHKSVIAQLISLQQYFPIFMPCNITRYHTSVIAQTLLLCDVLASLIRINVLKGASYCMRRDTMLSMHLLLWLLIIKYLLHSCILWLLNLWAAFLFAFDS